LPDRRRVLSILSFVLGIAPSLFAQPAPRDRVRLTLDTSEADQVLGILALREAGRPIDDARWTTLFVTPPYQRLKQREQKIGEQFHDVSGVFTDEDFRKVVLSDELKSLAPRLRETLERWKQADLRRSAERVLAYLPDEAVIRAKVYPVIKPAVNSFVWELSSDPTIFLYLDPEVTRDKFDNNVAHELHHIGLGSLGPVYAEKTAALPERARTAAESLSLVGGLIGSLLGFGVTLMAGQAFEDGLPVSPLGLALAAAFAIVIGLAAGVYPALRASRLTPVDAIRAG
jgi:hypothetical protein